MAPIFMPVEDTKKGWNRRNYAERIKPFATDYYYYYENGNWGSFRGANGGDPRLVEVWEDPSKPERILIHVSRRAFVWVGDDLTQKGHWQRKVVGALSASMVARKRGLAPHSTALDALQMKLYGNKQTTPGGGSKVEERPAWATESNLIGYTCETSIIWRTDGTDIVPILGNLNLTRLPSVYYNQGHLTTDHALQGNIGWRTEVGPCLFFGNVPVYYVDPDLLK